MRVTVAQGDITKVEADAIVNAANVGLLGGGGVDGAIHAAAGIGLVRACAALPEVRPGVRCPTGEARITPAYALRAKFVIHTVGPIFDRRERAEAIALLESCVRSSLSLAVEKGVKTVAMPAVSCGIYGGDLPAFAGAVGTVVAERDWSLEELRIVLFSARDKAAFEAAWQGLGRG